MPHTALRIEFGSERFSLDSPCSAGDAGMPGEDLCRWLRDALPQWTLDYMEEDWGWLLGTDRTRTDTADTDHQLCVYAYPPGTPDGDGVQSTHGEWMLVLYRRVRSTRLKFLHRWDYTAFDASLAADVIAALRGIDARDLRASALQMDGAGRETAAAPYLPDQLTL